MNFLLKLCDATVLIITLLTVYECTRDAFHDLDKKYYLVSEAYNMAKHLFDQGRSNYSTSKTKSLNAMDTFLDLVNIMNGEMAKELRSAVLKLYKVKYLQDFTNYVISMEEMIDIVEHCLLDPVEKLEQIRTQFHDVINNFQDSRNFDSVNKCHKELPDEVAAAHCLLHQAVLFNETMQEDLVMIIEIKTKQYAQDMNISLYNVQTCFNNFVPKFFEQLMLDAYTDKCGYLRVINASIADLIDKSKNNKTLYTEKWSPFLKLFKEKTMNEAEISQQPLHSNLLSAYVSSQDLV